MKNTKKTLALLLAVVLLAVCAVPAMAATQVTMEIGATDTHQYKVYQIFTGDVSDDGATLSNVKYGSNYGDTGTAVAQDVLDGITDADEFARSIYSSLKGEPVGTLTKGNTSVAVDPGYYLIVDDTSIDLSDGDSYSAYMVEILGETKITPKKDTTSVDKEITSDTLGKDDATTTVNGKVDNVSIGDTVNFKISGTIPAHATDYDYYFYILGDTLSDGLTFDEDSIKVYVTSVDEDNLLEKDTDYAVYTGDDADDNTFQVAMIDAISLAGKTIIVTYSATLNENAKVGELSNDNTVTIKYSNNPNYDYDGDKDNTKPGKPDSAKNTPLGETPESTTKTYTTGIEIKKVDQDGNILTGAEFTITGDNMEIVLVSEEKFTEDGEGTYYKLTNGTYTTEAPVTADYMKEAASGATAGYVVAEAGYDGEDAVVISGTTYRPYNSETDTDVTVYVLVKANTDLYVSTETKYTKTVTYTQKDTNKSGVTATASVGPDGKVTFNGLGAGTYTISETKTPDGYNTIADITVKITFDADKKEFSATEKVGNGNEKDSTVADNIVYLTVVNNSGSTLPSTGGSGTAMFRLLGGALVLGAAVVLISKRRMGYAK